MAFLLPATAPPRPARLPSTSPDRADSLSSHTLQGGGSRTGRHQPHVDGMGTGMIGLAGHPGGLCVLATRAYKPSPARGAGASRPACQASAAAALVPIHMYPAYGNGCAQRRATRCCWTPCPRRRDILSVRAGGAARRFGCYRQAAKRARRTRVRDHAPTCLPVIRRLTNNRLPVGDSACAAWKGGAAQTTPRTIARAACLARATATTPT